MRLLAFRKRLSEFVSCEETVLALYQIMDSFVFQGVIQYNTFTDAFGNSQNNSLAIYQQKVKTISEYRVLNAEKGEAVNVIISVLAALLSSAAAGLEVFAAQILITIVTAVGTTIVGGRLQDSISQKFYIKGTEYRIKARDVSENRELIFPAEEYHILLDGETTSGPYYNGPCPWDTDNAAYSLHERFWSHSCPGVKQFVYA